MSATDFEPDRSIPSVRHAPKVGHNEVIARSSRNFKGMFGSMGYRVVLIFKAILLPVFKISFKWVFTMTCENVSKNFPIAMKFSDYFPLYEDTSAIELGPDRCIRLAGHGPKVGHNELDYASGCK